ncbi:hypothetical protein GOZ78_03860 [Agrobacterium vitis]|uniref:Uncharacterized protein n=1 Tax=Agrobacterium vitis TaxID=373 RepID=A0ABD6GG19_AGRVI|nr:hypothetical protein [Agrobacterium vitis]MUO96679.1 hypothetical protein [Agrobacterium vitis]MUP04852.1 hypothetical protein [Agrobacterium vitis]MUZ80709.1 hypothetical protein [Agrobacterium vitis]MVA09155.1 hypothetical protein [Agrobacterium vitis]MVA93211.1 hypothetical protein [Agrobacterium vitis]
MKVEWQLTGTYAAEQLGLDLGNFGNAVQTWVDSNPKDINPHGDTANVMFENAAYTVTYMVQKSIPVQNSLFYIIDVTPKL